MGEHEMTKKLTTYDPAEDLTSDEAIATFMAEAFETNDASYIAHALGVVARAKEFNEDGYGKYGKSSEVSSSD
jgi:probable addiction module antidote protein